MKVKLLSTFLLVLALDQFSKWWAFSKGMVTLNQGISFSLGSGSLDQLFLASLMVLIGFGLTLFFRKKYRHSELSLGLLWGGLVGNVIDRVRLGGVQDWLVIEPFPWKNNLADIAIVSALAWLAWITLKESEKEDGGRK